MSLEEARPVLATRERCAMCHEYSGVGFWVPDDVWEAAVHPHWQNSTLCLRCFVVGADQKLIPWDESIKLFPVSFITHLRQIRQVAP